LQAQIEQLEFDLEMQRRKQAKSGNGEDVGARREVMQLQEQIQDREFEIDRARQEAMRLKHDNDRLASDLETLHQRLDQQDQLLLSRDQERA